MSLVNLANVCSHLQNASKARLGLTSINLTKLHLRLALALLHQGFLSSVTVGGRRPPELVIKGQSPPTAGELEAEPWLAYPVAGQVYESVVRHPIPDNPAHRRLWLGLKYWNNEPVLSKVSAVSKPKRRITLRLPGISRVARGRESGYVDGLTKVGECMFVSTDKGIFELRECLERRLGGMVLCRVR